MILMLDSNIIIDRLCKREPFYELSSKVCLIGVMGDAQTYITVNMLTDIFYIMKKEYGSENSQRRILDALKYLKVCAVSAQDGIESLKLGWNDYEDCLLSKCAESIKADFIITRNKNDFKRSKVKAIKPSEILEIMKAQHGLTYAEVELS